MQLFNIQGHPAIGENPRILLTIPACHYRYSDAGKGMNTDIPGIKFPNLRQCRKQKKMEENRMARIAGVDLPRDKRVEIGLTYIYGIGRPSATRILEEAGVDPNTRCRDLTTEDEKKISKVIDESQIVEGDLRREIALNIKRLQEIGCYRGIRHRRGLPVRGQKTKTNARTRKGPKRTVANKKK